MSNSVGARNHLVAGGPNAHDRLGANEKYSDRGKYHECKQQRVLGDVLASFFK
jgi:hypothetical protein